MEQTGSEEYKKLWDSFKKTYGGHFIQHGTRIASISVYMNDLERKMIK